MLTMKRAGLLLALCLLPALMMGCLRGNAVKLTYANMATPPACAGEAVIFRFADERGDTNTIGQHQNGQAITTPSNVSDWVGWALFDEMKAAGSDIKYRTTTVTPTGSAIITGEILEVALNQTGNTTFKARVVINFRVTKQGQPEYVEKYISEVEDAVVVGYKTQSEILADALQGVLTEAVPVICDKL